MKYSGSRELWTLLGIAVDRTSAKIVVYGYGREIEYWELVWKGVSSDVIEG
jgi:hypothetical protein